MATRYELRKKDKKNYKDLCRVQLPRAKHIKKDDTLHELKIVEEDVHNSRVKVHYIGYDSDDDEWRDKADTVSMKPQYESGKLAIQYSTGSHCMCFMQVHFTFIQS